MTLTQRLSLVFALLLLICCGTSVWLQVRSNKMHELEVVQGLSRDLAQHIARDTQLMDANGLKPDAVRELFSQLMLVNPSVEVYLLDMDGKIVGDAAPKDRILRDRIDLGPVRQLLSGAPLPILGDDPRSLDARKVFSAAPLMVMGKPSGFLYVVLLGEAHDRFAERGATSEALNTALWSSGLIALLCLFAGLAAFGLITRPLRRLTDSVGRFDINAAPVARPSASVGPTRQGHDEIAVLDAMPDGNFALDGLHTVPAEECADVYRGFPQTDTLMVAEIGVYHGRQEGQFCLPLPDDGVERMTSDQCADGEAPVGFSVHGFGERTARYTAYIGR